VLAYGVIAPVDMRCARCGMRIDAGRPHYAVFPDWLPCGFIACVICMDAIE